MSTNTLEVKTGCLRVGNALLPLTKMEVTGHITGLLQRTRVCQTFHNDHNVPLEAIYIHPLPPRAAVHGFRLAIGDRVVEGVVQERAQARQAYAEAVAQGHRAALMEEDRSDIFTTTVGNIAPGERVSISFELSGPLEFLGSTASLRFPMVVPEVYISGRPLGGPDVGDGTAADTDAVADASRLTPPRLAPGAANPVDLRLSFTVDPAGLRVDAIDSLCHFAKTRLRDDGCTEISLLPGVERMDRDFVVRLKLKEGTLQTTLISDPATGSFALTVVPPLNESAAHLAPRDLVIVLDRSGSMKGFCMTAARRAAARIVESLTPRDRFALVAFSSNCQMLDPHLVPAGARNQQRALEFLAGLEANGGTRAWIALDQALKLLRSETTADRSILFLTDGDVGNDAELGVRAASGVRVHTVGIGCNLRAGVLESMARISGGLCTLIPDQSTLQEALRDLHQRLGRPLWLGLSVRGVSPDEQAPRFWDVWEGVPTTFFGRASYLGLEATVEGWQADIKGPMAQRVMVVERDDLVIHRSWARARLLELDDLWTIGKVQEGELVALSVQAQVLCRFTAFSAIDRSEVVADSPLMRTVVQPVEPTLRANRDALPLPPAVRSRRAPLMGSAPASPPVGKRVGILSKRDAQGPLGEKPTLGGRNPNLSAEAPPASARRPSLRDEQAAPPPGRACSPPPPPPPPPWRAKREAPPSVWRLLLELLDELLSAPPERRASLVETMIDRLAEHARRQPAGQDSLACRDVMSLLVDLQRAVGDARDAKPVAQALRTVLVPLAG